MRPCLALVGSLALLLALPLLAQTTPTAATTGPVSASATAPVSTNASLKLDGAFGLRFGTAVKELVPFLPVAQREPDPSSLIRPPLPDARFDRDRYEIHITRETGLVWSIEASKFSASFDDDPKLEALGEKIAATLTAKYGNPFRDRSLMSSRLSHLVWRTDTGAIILDASPTAVHVSYQDDHLAEQGRQETLAALKAGHPNKRRWGSSPPIPATWSTSALLAIPTAASSLTPTVTTAPAATNPPPQIEGAFGVRFGSHFKSLQLGGEPYQEDPDPSLPFVPSQPETDPLLKPATYGVAWTRREGLVWGVEAMFGPITNQATREAQIIRATAALTARYGAPIRDYSVGAIATRLVWHTGENAIILEAEPWRREGPTAREDLSSPDEIRPGRYFTVLYQNGPLAEQAHREGVAFRQAHPDPFRNLSKVVPLYWPTAPK